MRGPIGESSLPDQQALYHWNEHSITSTLSFCVYTPSPARSEQTAGTATVAHLVSAESHRVHPLPHFVVVVVVIDIHDLFDCFTYQVTCSTVTMGGHADQ